MTTRTVQGLVFTIRSPSFWELAGCPVDISYLGDRWYLFCPDQTGERRCHGFDTRDQAIGLIATAFRNVGRLPPVGAPC